jgi:hypothetical protein
LNYPTISHCLSCGADFASHQTHTESYHDGLVERTLPLCDLCLEFPRKMDMSTILEKVFLLDTSTGGMKALLEALIHNKTSRYQNPGPVIIGIILTELTDHGGRVLVGKRASTMHEYPDTWALVSGYMETKHGGWRGDLAVEAREEVSALIHIGNPSLVYPLSFDSPPSARLLLNCAVVEPGAVSLEVFVPNKETVERAELPFSKGVLPEFGIPAHNTFFRSFCEQRFGW